MDEGVGEEDCPQAWRRGEGTTGAVGFGGALRREIEAEGFIPFTCGPFESRRPVGVLWKEDIRSGVKGIFKVCASATLFGEGGGAAERGGGTAEDPLGVGDDAKASSPTRRRLVSLLIGSAAFSGLSRRTRREVEGRGESPNAGEWNLFRERAGFALPAPSQRYIPLGFCLRSLVGDEFGINVAGLR